MTMTGKLDGKIAVVTGGSAGISRPRMISARRHSSIGDPRCFMAGIQRATPCPNREVTESEQTEAHRINVMTIPEASGGDLS